MLINFKGNSCLQDAPKTPVQSSFDEVDFDLKGSPALNELQSLKNYNSHQNNFINWERF